MLKVTNPGAHPAAVAKPLLPKRWSIRFVDRRPGKNLKREWVGGVIQGSTDSGQPPRYTDAEYEIIPPGGEFTKSIDLGWLLRDQSPSLNSGEYEITFFYDYPPNESERDLPLIDYPLRSNKLRVIVLGG